MRNLRMYFLPFLSGLLITMLIHLSYRCQKDSDLPDNDPGITANLVQLNDDAQQAEDAFISGDIEQVKLVMTPEMFEFYKDVIEAQTPERLSAYGSALKGRLLKKYSALYAEYEFTEAGRVYTVTFAVQGDKSWKITRF